MHITIYMIYILALVVRISRLRWAHEVSLKASGNCPWDLWLVESDSPGCAVGSDPMHSPGPWCPSGASWWVVSGHLPWWCAGLCEWEEGLRRGGAKKTCFIVDGFYRSTVSLWNFYNVTVVIFQLQYWPKCGLQTTSGPWRYCRWSVEKQNKI